MLFTKPKTVSVFEAQALWLLLSTKYQQRYQIQFWIHCAHDLDLVRLLKDFEADLDEHIGLLEKRVQTHSIAEAPARPSKDVPFQKDTVTLTDEFIGTGYLTFMQGMVEQVLFSIQYSTLNDDIAKFFSSFSSHVLEQTDSLIRYLRVKGWLDTPPYYRNPHRELPETINCFEAFHLWAHTDYRYTNMEETQRWIQFVNDKDFVVFLEAGIRVMEKQISKLEVEMQRFGIPMSKRPPVFLGEAKDKELFKDKHIYKTLFTGLQWAGVLHANAFKNSITNDRIRSLFKDFLYTELDLVRNSMKYGKMKGWLSMPPVYEG